MLRKTLRELELEERVRYLEHQNDLLKQGLHPSFTEHMNPENANELCYPMPKEIRLPSVASVGVKVKKFQGVQYFAKAVDPVRGTFSMNLFADASTVWNQTSAEYVLDQMNANIQHELLSAILKVKM